MKLLALAMLTLVLTSIGNYPSRAAATFDPIEECHVSKMTNKIAEIWVGGWPTQFNKHLRLSVTTEPLDLYRKGVGFRCPVEYDADLPMPNGSYTRTLCAPQGWGSSPNTPTCLGK